MAKGYTQAYFERLDKNGQRVGEQLKVQFNPNELSISKGAEYAEIGIPGLDSPIVQFVRGQSEQVSLELFFDTTADGTGARARSVTEKTNAFYALVKMTGSEHAPPRCRFGWGDRFPGLIGEKGAITATRSAFECVVENIQQRFTLFNPAGVPLRATLSVTLREYTTLRRQIEQLNLKSADHTRVHTVQRGDTLPKIAADAYGEPRRWRDIADANDILHPRSLPPGTVLQLPPVETR